MRSFPEHDSTTAGKCGHTNRQSDRQTDRQTDSYTGNQIVYEYELNAIK